MKNRLSFIIVLALVCSVLFSSGFAISNKAYASYFDISGEWIRTGQELDDWNQNRADLEWRSTKAYKHYYEETQKNKELEEKLAAYKEKHKFDDLKLTNMLTKERAEKTNQVINATKSTLTTICKAIKDKNNGGDFDTSGCIDNVIDSLSSIANCCGPWGAVASSVLNIGKAAFHQIMGGSEPASELSQFEARIDQKFEELNRKLSEIENQISELSADINMASDKTIAEITNKIDKTVASEHVREFQTRGVGNFSYKEFRNYIYGNDNSAEAYCNILKEIQRAPHSNDDVKYYYDLVYSALIENTEIFYDYLLPLDGKSIIQEYYDVLTAKSDIDESEAEYQALLFAYDLYQSALAVDTQLLLCGSYQYSCVYKEWFEKNVDNANFDLDLFDENSLTLKYEYAPNKYVSLYQINEWANEISEREDALLKQLAKDITYILTPQNSYVIESDGLFYTINNISGTSFGNVTDGQTVYLSFFPSSVYDFFGDFCREDFSYSLSAGVPVNNKDTNGIFTVSGNGEFCVYLKYKQESEPLCSIAFSSNYGTNFNGGDGSEYSPYLISNKEQFKLIRNDLSKHYRLIKDINFNGEDLYSFGYRIDEKGNVFYDEFSGSLDGNGYSVKNVNIFGGKFAGLFCKIGENGRVENLSFDNVKIKEISGINAVPTRDMFYAGIITGTNAGQITNCRVVDSSITYSINNRINDASTSISMCVGGIAGSNSNFISSCLVDALVAANLTHDFAGNATNENKIYIYAGGVCGQNGGNVIYTLVSAGSEITANATAKLSPNNTVNPYVESYAGRVCGKNAGALTKVCAENGSTSRAFGNIEHYDSKWGKGYNNRIESSTNVNIADNKGSFYSADYAELQTKLSQLTRKVYVFDWGYDSDKNISYKVTENGFHTDGFNIYYYKNNIRTKVDVYSIIAVYGLYTRNASFEAKSQNVTILFSAEIEDTNYFGTLVIPVTIEANTVNVYAENLSENLTRGTIYSFNDATITWDYAVGTDQQVTINSSSINDSELPIHITVQGTFTDKNGNVTNVNTTNTTNLPLQQNVAGTYVVDIFYKGELVAKDFVINVICPNTLENENKFVIDKIVEATCISNGETHYACKDCGEIHTIIDYTAKGNHSFIIITEDNINDYANLFESIRCSKPASCNSTGLLVEICEHCHKYVETIIPQLAHDYRLITEDNPRHICSLCKTEELHQYVVTESIENGVLTYHYHCTFCGHESEIQDTNIKPAGKDKIPMVYVSDGYAINYGDTVKIYIQLQNNPGISGAVFGVRYDNRLVFIDKEEGEIFNYDLNNDSRNKDNINYGFNFIWNKIDGGYTYKQGNLVVLTFRLPDSIKEGESAEFKVEVTYGDIPQANGGKTDCGFLCEDGVRRRFYTKAGYIKMVDHLPGDVDNNGKVTLYDAILISKSLIDRETVIDLRYGNVDASDDGIQINDVQRILQSLRGAESLIASDYDVILNPSIVEGLKEDRIHVYLYDSYDNSTIPHTYIAGIYQNLPDLNGKRPGYTFLGWYTRIEGGNQVENGDYIKYDQNQWIQTLYARWEINTVTYYDGTTELARYEYGNVQEYSSEIERVVNVLLKNENGIFETDYSSDFENLHVKKSIRYWETEDGEKYYSGECIDITERSLKLYAIWDYALYQNGKRIALDELKLINLQNKNGYRITNLYANADGTGELTTIASVLANCSNDGICRLYARTSLIEYTIYYVPNGDDVTPSTTQSELGTILSTENLSEPFSRTGYGFLGYALSENGDLVYESGVKRSYVSNDIYYNAIEQRFEITLYAVWDPILIYTLSNDNSYYSVSGINERYSTAKDVVIRSEFNGKPVAKISSQAFMGCNGLASITIPDSIISIGSEAFRGCGFTTITLPNSLESIGYQAFQSCALTSITIPNSVKDIGDYAFYCSKNLTAVEIGKGVIELGYASFHACDNLERVTFSEGSQLQIIRDSAFNHCIKLQAIYIPDTVTTIEKDVFFMCNSLTEMSIPFVGGYTKEGEKIDCFGFIFWGVHNVDFAMMNEKVPASLKKVIITGGTSISSYAFKGCSSLNNVILPNSVTSIKYEAFNNCTNLTSIIIPDSVKNIDNRAFCNCLNLISVTVGENMQEIGGGAFMSCGNLVEVINKSGLNIKKGSDDFGDIGKYAWIIKTGGDTCTGVKDNYLFISYENTNYLLGYIGKNTDLVFPSDYKGQSYEIYERAFIWNDNLTSIVINSGVTRIGTSAFYGCGALKSVTIGSSVKEIGLMAFERCQSLQSVVLSEGLQIIGYQAFYRCSLISIVIPASVNYIGESALYENNSLTNITFVNTTGWAAYNPDASSSKPVALDLSRQELVVYWFTDMFSWYYWKRG